MRDVLGEATAILAKMKVIGERLKSFEKYYRYTTPVVVVFLMNHVEVLAVKRVEVMLLVCLPNADSPIDDYADDVCWG